MARILLVEDNPKYASPAEEYLASRSHAVQLAKDYSEAISNLKNPEFDGVITDCFFPNITGSGNIDLGIELVGRMAESDPSERKIGPGLEVLGQYVNLEDKDMRKYARCFVNRLEEGEDILEDSTFRAIRKVSSTSGKEAATLIAKNTLGMTYQEKKTPRDFFGALMKAMKESEANQPLGLLVAERARDLRLPFILATSTYHHDILTQPIQNYAGNNGWALIDCGPDQEDEKATPEFWKRAVGVLERKLD
ncbi:response regulator [Candidatus Woesearchaeota archaeon]|nr:response regulator [Candidatus Woesearchaeota archaeon]